MAQLADCNLNTLSTASKCFDCLSSTEKLALTVYLMALLLKQKGGTDLTDKNTRNSAAACFCVPDFRLESMELAIWKSAAEKAGITLPSTIDGLRALIKCVPCGEQQTTRAAYTLILCKLSAVLS